MSIEIHELTSEDVQRRFLAELTVERVRELAEQVGLDPASETPVDDFLAGQKIDHETILEFCTSYELKDLCRVLELPSDGGEAESLRKRIRTRLYFPPDPDGSDCPDALRDSRERRARRRAEKEREFEAFQRRLILRWGVGGGATLCLLGVLSPFQTIPGAFYLLPIGVVASTIIVRQQFGHVGGAITLGFATSVGSMLGAALGWCAIDLFLWAAATALGGIIGIGAQLAGENPHPTGGPELPAERRPLIELLRMLSEPRLNSLLLETDLTLDPDADRDLLVTQLSNHAAFDRTRLVRSLDERELREVARRCGRPEGDDDLDEHQLRAVIERQFEIAFDVR